MPLTIPIEDLCNTTGISNIDQTIYESELEMTNGAEAIDAEVVFAELEKKYRSLYI